MGFSNVLVDRSVLTETNRGLTSYRKVLEHDRILWLLTNDDITQDI
jgi:hypothetical protein